MSDCTFCRILDGDLPAHVVLDSPHGLGFLDRTPLFHGHTLWIPRQHHVTLSDLPSALVGPFFEEAQRLSLVMVEALGAKGSFVAMNNVVSQSVPHLHVHVVPRRPKDGLRGFFWPRTSYDDEEHMARTAATLRGALEA